MLRLLQVFMKLWCASRINRLDFNYLELELIRFAGDIRIWERWECFRNCLIIWSPYLIINPYYFFVFLLAKGHLKIKCCVGVFGKNIRLDSNQVEFVSVSTWITQVKKIQIYTLFLENPLVFAMDPTLKNWGMKKTQMFKTEK